MIIRHLDSIAGSARHVRSRTNKEWSSARFLLEEDGFPFSLNLTRLASGCRMDIAYQHHCEACYCVSGNGLLIEPNGATHKISPGLLYALEKGERHTLEATEDLTLISVFSPTLTGPEIHDKNGSYPAPNLDA